MTIRTLAVQLVLAVGCVAQVFAQDRIPDTGKAQIFAGLKAIFGNIHDSSSLAAFVEYISASEKRQVITDVHANELYLAVMVHPLATDVHAGQVARGFSKRYDAGFPLAELPRNLKFVTSVWSQSSCGFDCDSVLNGWFSGFWRRNEKRINTIDTRTLADLFASRIFNCLEKKKCDGLDWDDLFRNLGKLVAKEDKLALVDSVLRSREPNVEILTRVLGWIGSYDESPGQRLRSAFRLFPSCLDLTECISIALSPKVSAEDARFFIEMTFLLLSSVVPRADADRYKDGFLNLLFGIALSSTNPNLSAAYRVEVLNRVLESYATWKPRMPTDGNGATLLRTVARVVQESCEFLGSKPCFDLMDLVTRKPQLQVEDDREAWIKTSEVRKSIADDLRVLGKRNALPPDQLDQLLKNLNGN